LIREKIETLDQLVLLANYHHLLGNFIGKNGSKMLDFTKSTWNEHLRNPQSRIILARGLVFADIDASSVRFDFAKERNCIFEPSFAVPEVLHLPMKT
jgi:hypothetical protein